jgi:hypothetical protein
MSTYEIDIQPSSVSKTAVKVSLFLQYVFKATDAKVFCYVYDVDGHQLDVQTVYVPPEVYSTWTDDDNVIIDYVMRELNFTPV